MKYFGKPDFYRYKKEFNLTGLNDIITWYIDFSDKKSKVLSLFFETESSQTKEEAELLCEWATGKQLGVMPKHSEVPLTNLFSPAFLSFRLFMLELLGKSLPFHVQKGCLEEDLICRCFGVYKQELMTLLSDAGANQYTIADLGAMSRAGIGCSSCHHDLENLLELFGHKERNTFQKSWKAMNDQELAGECNAILKAWAHAKILGQRPGGLLIKAEESVRADIKKAIDEKLGVGLTISFR